uniref:Uncharacterized protein n=1 Tax=Lactuca sativa TaxID=4236 RepID=A0A9R1X1T1_LACSA|nr:hypothetical protein LSAT_V11C700346320 [Lactuca sativa]
MGFTHLHMLWLKLKTRIHGNGFRHTWARIWRWEETLTSHSLVTDKRVIPVIAHVFPNCEHQYSLRYIHENMRLQWKGDDIKDQVWICGRVM